MSINLINKLNDFSSFKMDLQSKRINNLKSIKDVNFEELFEISYLLDSSYFNYKIDKNLNIIGLIKK